MRYSRHNLDKFFHVEITVIIFISVNVKLTENYIIKLLINRNINDECCSH